MTTNPIQIALDYLANRIKALESRQIDWRWGEVVQTSPLQVLLEGDPAPVTVGIFSAVPNLTVGRRVWTQTVSGQLIILAAA